MGEHYIVIGITPRGKKQTLSAPETYANAQRIARSYQGKGYKSIQIVATRGTEGTVWRSG